MKNEAPRRLEGVGDVFVGNPEQVIIFWHEKSSSQCVDVIPLFVILTII